MRRISVIVVPLVVCILVCILAPDVIAQARTVTGTVVDTATHQPVSGAQIGVQGTTLGTLADERGTFTLHAPPGPISLVVRRIGYLARTVPVAADQNTVRVALEQDVLHLEQIVVTGRATNVERQNAATAVSVVTSSDVTRVQSQTIEQALQGKVAGANIQSNSGAPGGGMQIQLRGTTSIIGNSQPLYVVDGVIVSNDAIPGGQNSITQAAGPSTMDPSGISSDEDNPANRLADLNPNDIESITVLKGASASAIYGSKASNGVIIITTKRGVPGKATFNISQGMGYAEISRTLGLRRFTDSLSAMQAFGPQAAQYFEHGEPPFYNHELELAGHKPLLSQTSISVSGGSQTTHYFASGLWDDEGGIITNTGFNKQSGRLNLEQLIGSRITLNLGANLVHDVTQRGLTNNDNTSTSFYMTLPSEPSFVNLMQNADGTFPANPFATSNTNQTAALLTNRSTVWRFIGNGRTTVNLLETPRHSLQFIGTLGTDFFNQKDFLFSPATMEYEEKLGTNGTSVLSNANSLNTNINGNLVYKFTPASTAYTATTSFGINRDLRQLDVPRVKTQQLIGGQSNIDQGTQVTVGEVRNETRDFGLFAQEEFLGLSQRMLLTVGATADQSSANGDPGKMYFYPKASASYHFPVVEGKLDDLKLRIAFGMSGNEPLYGQKFTELASGNTNGVPGLILAGQTATSNLRPELEQELEGGFDATLFGNRATFSVTGFRKHITDLLMQRNLPQSSGFTQSIFNGGVMNTEGLETELTVAPLQSSKWNWTLNANLTATHSVIAQLPVPPFDAGGFGLDLGAIRIQQGASPTQIVGQDTTPDGSVFVTKLGDVNPKFRAGFGNDVGYGPVHLYFLFDWQQGGMVDNLTAWLYDLTGQTPDWGDTIVVGGTKMTKGAYRLASYEKSTAVYLQPATFVKLREVSLSVDVPVRYLHWAGGPQSAKLTLDGRNLYTWTKYGGLDPEVSNFGDQQIARNYDVAPYPPSRSFWLTLNLGY